MEERVDLLRSPDVCLRFVQRLVALGFGLSVIVREICLHEHEIKSLSARRCKTHVPRALRVPKNLDQFVSQLELIPRIHQSHSFSPFHTLKNTAACHSRTMPTSDSAALSSGVWTTSVVKFLKKGMKLVLELLHLPL